MSASRHIVFLLFVTIGYRTAGASNDALLQAVSTYYVGTGLAKGVACDGSNYLIAIQSAASNQIIAQFVAQTGIVTGASLNVGVGGGRPLVSFDGKNYLIVWADAPGPA